MDICKKKRENGSDVRVFEKKLYFGYAKFFQISKSQFSDDRLAPKSKTQGLNDCRGPIFNGGEFETIHPTDVVLFF